LIDAGLGCFAGRSWNANEAIGLYWGKFFGKGKTRFGSNYAIQLPSKNFRVASRKLKHMAYHFANQVESKEMKANIIIRPNLLIETIRPIKEGEELLLKYNLFSPGGVFLFKSKK
jgi:hypothetical protein